MRSIGKRILSMLCALVMLLSMAAMITPVHTHAEHVSTGTVAELDALLGQTDSSYYKVYDATQLQDYSVWNNRGAGQVEDTESVVGYALKHDATDITNPETAVKIAWSKDGTQEIGRVNGDNLIIDGAYHVYKFTYTIPETMAAEGFFYLFGTWQLQLQALPGYLAERKGQTVDLYLSLKATGEKTAATCYVDRVVVVEPQKVEEEVPPLVFYADDFYCAYGHDNGDGVVEDAESAQGKALRVSYADRAAINDKGMMNATLFGDGKTMKFYAQASVGNLVGEISIEELRANQGNGYFTYIFHDVKMMEETDSSVFIYFFEDWSIQLKLNDYVEQLKGKTVDFAVSMKITGNVSDATNDTPTYYLDKVVIAFETLEEEHNHNYKTATYVDENNHSVACACGETKTEAHTWDDGVVANGEITYTCSVCGGTKKEAAEEEVPTLVFYADDFYCAYGHDNGDGVVEDAESAQGKALRVSYADRAAINDKGMMNATLFGDGKTMKFYAQASVGNLVGEISIEELRANQGNGYFTYIFHDVKMMEETDSSVFIYFFEDWSIQLKLNDYVEQLKGKTVDFAVSMKITGNVSDAANDTPTYYLDKVVIAFGTYEEEHNHKYQTGTYVDEDSHLAECACGDTKTEAHKWDDGVVANGEVTYTCSVCGGTKKEAQELTIIFLADDFVRPYGDPIVEDSDSAHGKAVKYSYADRKAAFDTDPSKPSPMAMIRVGAQTLDVRTPNDILVGSWTITQLQEASGTGYVLTKFENIQLTDANFIYIFDCWGFQVPLTAHKDTLAGQTVNVYVSMKITGNVSDTTDDVPTYYIDKVVITTGEYEQEHVHNYENWIYVDENNHSAECACGDVKTEGHTWDDGVAANGEITYTCSVCGGTKTEAEPGELMLDFYASDFVRPYGDPVVIDEDSIFGTAVKYSYADRKPAHDLDPANKPSPMAMIRVEPQTLDVRTPNNILVGKWSVTELKAAGDTGYVVYAFTDVDLTDANFIYIFDCWGFQVPLTQHKDLLKNRTVNVYISMKITGDVTNTGKNSPAYYIDRVVISTGEYVADSENHSYGDWVYVDENTHSSTCSHCDDVLTDTHKWDEGVVTLKPTVDEEGKLTFTCSMCKGTKVEKLNKVNPEGINLVFYPDKFFLAYGDPIVNDSSAEGGKAAKFSYKDRLATGDKGLYNAMIFGGDHMLDVRTNNNICIGRLPAGTLMKNAEKGKYLTYKFSNIDLTDAGFIYIFDCWGFQVKLGEYADILRNEKVYVYVTLKVTGNVGDRENDMPTYYISKVEISSKNRTVDSDMKDPVNIVIPASEFAMPYKNADSIKSDSQSKYGKAAVFSYEKRLATGDKGLYNAMIFGGERALELYSHGGEDGAKQAYLLGSISNERMNYHANKDGYVVYTFRNVKMIPTAGSYIFYMFDCWGMNIPLTEAQLQELRGQRVDVSVSMKITGNVMDPNNPPTYYIDYVKFVSTAGSGCVHDYCEWTSVDNVEHSKECLGCGDIVKEEHKWDEGVEAEDLPEGHKIFTCTVCGITSQGENPGENVETEPPTEHTHIAGEYANVDENQHSCTCNECGEVVTEAHTWDNGTVAQEATTEKTGEMLYTCTACGATKSETIDKLTEDNNNGGDVIDDAGSFFTKDILTWAILVGLADLAIIIFIIVLIKKRKK